MSENKTKIQQLEQRIKSLEEENESLKESVNKNSRQKQKQILDKLKESEERYILIQSLAHVGSWEPNFREENIWASDETFNLLGIEKKSNYISFDELLNVIHSDDKLKFENFLKDLNEKKKDFNTELKIVRYVNDDRDLRFVHVITKVLKNENGNSVKIIGAIKDITNFKKTIRELNRAKDRAEESDRLKTSFLSNMSHDLRTPMNAIIGYSELLNIGHLSPSNRREYTKIIKSKGLQLLTLIDDLIEVAKFETGNIQINKIEFDLNNLLSEVYNYFMDKKIQLGKEHIQLVLKRPDEPSIQSIYSDSGRIYQVLSNLISNALKYTLKGFVEFGYELEDNERLLFYVKDSGVGMSKEKQKYIFNRFKYIEKSNAMKFMGSGLGLTISKGILELLGGKIWVESEENKGATFYFTIPYEEAELGEELKIDIDKQVISNYNWKDKVILVVEDEEVNFKFLETVLHDTQAQVLHANDGMQAIDLCLSINKIDLILMDIKMPEMDGYEAAKRIKQIRTHIPIIAQTAFASREDKMNSLRSGCDDYIAKPIEIELLLSKINKFFVARDY